MFNKKFRRLIIFFFIIACVLIACNSADDGSTTIEPLPTATAVPQATLAPDRVVLFTVGEDNPDILAEAESVISQLADNSGLQFEVRTGTSPDSVTADVRIAVFLRKPENLGSLSTNSPTTQFIAITSEEWNPGGNVTIIRTQRNQTAFLSGYTSALVAPNFRVGALLTAEDPAFNQAFLNGVQYFCGTCTSIVYPLGEYPLISIQSASSPPATWLAAADQLALSTINVLFIAESAYSPELFSSLAARDTALVGTAPPPIEADPKWLITIRTDGIAPLQELWEGLLSGQGGKTVNANFKIENRQFIYAIDGLVWLSPGKTEYLMETVQLLRDGFIDHSATFN